MEREQHIRQEFVPGQPDAVYCTTEPPFRTAGYARLLREAVARGCYARSFRVFTCRTL